MTNEAQDKRLHFVLSNTSEAKLFTTPRSNRGESPHIPELPRAQHGASLQTQLQALKPIAEQAAATQHNMGLEGGVGLQIQFQSQPGIALAFESLANATQGIELLSIREEGEYTYANVFVPDGKLAHFEKYVAEYLGEKKNKNGDPIDHRPLLDTIEIIRAAGLRARWNDDPELLPQNLDEEFWWEVWLPERGNREAVVEDFRKLVSAVGCTVSKGQVDFPERTVVMMHGSERQFSQTVMTLNCVAELRRAKETAELFDGMDTEEQQAWKDDFLARTTFPAHADNVPRVCLLDSGVNRGHPLLSPVLTSDDMHTVEPAWGKDDECNHGTGLAGIAIYGDLTDALATELPLQIDHLLESVKITRGDGANTGTNEFHANLFAEAMARPESSPQQRPRVFSSAVTATDFRDRGRPSSWSSMVDSLAADAFGGGLFPRLIVLAAGNTREHHAWITYPASLSTNLIHDPGQAWNALTVGAFTEKVETEEASIEPVAPFGGLSPFTTTSAAWDRAWPLKPDVVFEGGNVGKDALGAAGMPSLNLLTTHYEHTRKLFTTTNATSAASALCARMAAQLMSAYPQLRPETIRALIVHSAEWTDAMREMYLKSHTKNDYINIVRHCGWGAPDLERALWSAANSLTLIVEDSVHPYKKDGSAIKTRDMNFHTLPWPKDELETLGETKVQMRVTLSYFIEPNPSARGSSSKYHYPSHRLRFKVRHHRESDENFLARINAAAAMEENGQHANHQDPDWWLGGQQRHKGSLHQDVWEGTAAELASRGSLAIYPAMGWWRTRPKLERYDLPAHYTLIVSILTPETEIDLYNAVAAKIKIPVVIST